MVHSLTLRLFKVTCVAFGLFLMPQNVLGQVCSSTVSTFPLTEGFESGLGTWTQATDDGFNWTRQSGGTATAGTGPSGAANGGYYIYTDSRSPNSPWKTAVINSPCIDFTNQGGGKIYFFYHMNGANVGWMQLQVSIDNGANWSVLWGAGGKAYGDKWIQQHADLSAYAGQNFRLRFIATMNSGSGGDIALDDISITSYSKYQAPNLSNENYVLTRTYQRETTSSNSIKADQDVVEQVTYFDGLGRPKQEVAVKASPEGKDIITHIGYDEFGRVDKEWLPYQESNGAAGSFRSSGVEGAIKNYYFNTYTDDFADITNYIDANPYSQKSFEASPLGRVVEQGAPGKDWRVDKNSDNDHTIKFSYQTNATNEVRKYLVNLDSNYTPSLFILSTDPFFEENQLYKTITKDENWISGKNNTTEEFTDKQGRVVLKRTFANVDVNNDGDTLDTGETEVGHDTYYVYDDYGNLSYVLPPKTEPTGTNVADNQDKLNNLCYKYKYDSRNRLVEKKIPGKEPEYIIYNKLDQPVMTQDGNQRGQTVKKWLFTKYDAFGRVAFTGSLINNHTREQIQTEADSFAGQLWVNRGPATVLAGIVMYYEDSGVPATGIDEIFMVNYYDDYEFPDLLQGIRSDTESWTVPLTSNVRGLPTFNQSKILGTSSFVRTLIKYDEKGRETWRKSVNDNIQSTHFLAYKLDFTGKILDIYTWHAQGSQPETIYMDHFDYDHRGRLLTHSQVLHDYGYPVEIISENTYDQLGQLVKKGVGNAAGRDRLQNIQYSYNIRGWLKEINDISNLTTENDLFAFRINYNTREINSPTSNALFNGNISETIWKTTNDLNSNITRGYAYGYDELNRITSADYATRTTGSYSLSSGYDMQIKAYDMNGNIKGLSRYGSISEGLIDDLSYQYEESGLSNRLRKVEDASLSVEGFKDGANTNEDYQYDENGNMKIDRNKSISDITYNHLNLPTSININGGNISYLYDATGLKLRKMSEGITTDYIENFIYKNGIVKFYSHPEGYVENDGNGGYNYVYNYKDHLGNVRLSYADLNNNGTIETSSEILEEKNYYPFGLEHKGYNNVIRGVENNYQTFQGQENTTDLGLNIHEWKYRISDPAIGRFWQVDPLAEDYVHNGTYNFSENRVIDAYELEGAEAVVITEEGTYSKLNVGHTFVTVGSGENTVAYTYGRYAELGKDKGSLNPTNLSGEGVLIRLEGQDAIDMIDKYINDFGAQAFEFTNADENGVANFFEEQFSSSDKIPETGEYAGDKRARIIDTYSLSDNNCTTISCKGISAGTGGNMTYQKSYQNNPKLAGGKGKVEVNIISATPRGIQTQLNEASQDPNSGVRNVTENYRRQP